MRALEMDEAFYPEVTEWDTGHVSVGNALRYFAPFELWPPSQQVATLAAGQSVLDIGAGAGRHSLHLQETGRAVVALDIDPTAVELMGERGLDARLGSLEQHTALECYDTLLLLGGNGSLLIDNPAALSACSRLTRPGAAVIAEIGRQSTNHGGVEVRVRFGEHASPWVRYAASQLGGFQKMIDAHPDFHVAAWSEYTSTTLVTLLRV